jgi:hypothetical protein
MPLSIEEVRGIAAPGPQFSYKFRVNLPDIGGSFNPSDQGSYLVEEIGGLPVTSIQQKQFNEGGGVVYFANTVEIETISITFLVRPSSELFNYFQAWRDLIINEDGSRNYPSQYKQSMLVELLDGNNQAHTSYRLLGVWPMQTQALGPLNYGTTDRIRWTQTFSVDSAELA